MARCHASPLFFYQSSWYVQPRGEDRIKIAQGTQEQKYLWRSGRRFRDGCFVPSEEVLATYGEWLGNKQLPSKGTSMTVSELVVLLLESREAERGSYSAKSNDECKRYLTEFAVKFGRLTISEISSEMVRKWIQGNKRWKSDATKATAARFYKLAFNFGIKSKFFSTSPLADLKSTSNARREHLISYEEQDDFLECCTEDFANYFRLMLETGRRPDEIASAKKSEVKEVVGGLMLELAKHKNAKKTGKPARVFLSEAAATIVRKMLADETNKTDFLCVNHFRGTCRHWRAITTIQNCKRARNDAGIEGLTCYSARHTFITRALIAGVPVATVASQCGTSIQMIEKHYNHVSQANTAVFFAAVQAANMRPALSIADAS